MADATADQADRYRPKAHYVRSPGPKWRAKHAEVTDRQKIITPMQQRL
jgi:hypothetical protein